jgi:hypothetical protein
MPLVTDSGGSSILAYQLVFSDGSSENSDTVMYEGMDRKQIVSGLATGMEYAVKYRVRNTQGWSDYSDVTHVYACSSPSGLEAPSLVMISQTYVQIEWTEPSNTGGCPVKSYSILRDGGPTDLAFTEVHQSEIQNCPQMYTYIITDLPENIVGQDIRIKMSVTNTADLTYVSDKVLIVTISDIPSQPVDGPQPDIALIDIDRITVSFVEPADGGAPLTSFEVQIDDGSGSSFVSITGSDTNFKEMTLTVRNLEGIVDQWQYDGETESFSYPIERGATYLFRYRAANINGWSEFSPITSVIAASKPIAPNGPVLLTSGVTSVDI